MYRSKVFGHCGHSLISSQTLLWVAPKRRNKIRRAKLSMSKLSNDMLRQNLMLFTVVYGRGRPTSVLQNLSWLSQRLVSESERVNASDYPSDH